MLQRQRLLVIHVQRRDDLASFDRGDKRGFVDQRSARRVDQDSPLLHASDILAADNSARLSGKANSSGSSSLESPRPYGRIGGGNGASRRYQQAECQFRGRIRSAGAAANRVARSEEHT